jgi:predicted phage terminase large subunit-like protein
MLDSLSKIDRSIQRLEKWLPKRGKKSPAPKGIPNFEDLVNAVMPDYEWNWHHSLIAKKIKQVLAGDLNRLIISMPPRHGKTQLASRFLPAYGFGVDPNMQMIACSYSADLSSRNNRDVQRIIDSDPYLSRFPNTRLSGKNVRSTSQGSWMRNSDIFEIVDHKGSYRSAGVGVGITGMGFSVGLIDDPIKDRRDASSPRIRESIWEWYTSTFRTRAEKDAAIIVIQTRWHEDDLVGRLLKSQQDPNADQWEVLSLPAVAEGELHPEDPRQEGEALWPSRYPLETLNKIKATSEYDWASLYQQRPSPKGGGIFKSHWWRIRPYWGPVHRLVWAWDLAVKGGSQNDWNVGVLLGEVDDGYQVLRVVRCREGYPQVKRLVVQCWEDQPGEALLIEDAANGSPLIQELQQSTRIPVLARPAKGSKVYRAQPVTPTVESGRVFLAESEWANDFVYEMSTFPTGAHDDQVDAFVMALSYFVMPRGIPEDYSLSLFGIG